MRITEERFLSLYGIGFIYGIDVHDSDYAVRIRKKAFENGLIFETCGPTKSVIKMIPPLTITVEELDRGLEIFKESLS